MMKLQLMKTTIPRSFLTLLFVQIAINIAIAQQPPAIGYMFPPGAKAGQTIDVILGGYDWTPDMQVFVHDPRIKLEILTPPGPVIVPEPPYWFGKKARRGPFLLPRETRARLTIPANTPAGIVRWQAANANGATATGQFLITDGGNLSASSGQAELPSDPLIEGKGFQQSQAISALPAMVFGQIKSIEEVDRYRFTAKKSGPISCSITARSLGSPLNAVLEVYDDTGRMIADAADTAGNDTALTFVAAANRSYTLSVNDVDFRGNRAFVYGLSITAGPQVVAAIPAAGKRGETRSVELVGYGVATGSAKLESVTRVITFPTDSQTTSLAYRLVTPHGTAASFILQVSEISELVETSTESRQLSPPTAITGVLEKQFGEDRYRLTGKQGDVWSIDLVAEKIASVLDVTLTIFDIDGKELARNDDLPGSLDAALAFTLPKDGEYQISVTDLSGQSGARNAVYRLAVQAAIPDFTLSVAEFINAPLGGKVKLALNATRIGGFDGPISISLDELPLGLTVAESLTIPAKKNTLSIEFTVAADAAAVASLVRITGEAMIAGKTISHTTDPLLIATTIKPPFAIDAEGKNDVTKWPRGTTFPAPVLIQREVGFNEEIMLEMTSRQGRHRQGISGPELTVPPGVERILYPIFLPEWLETTRTSRMVVNGVAKVTDPKGNIRYSVSRQKTRMGFLPVGALLKLSAKPLELHAEPGQSFSVPLTIRRSKQLTAPILLELQSGSSQTSGFTAKPKMLSASETETTLLITSGSTAEKGSEHELTLRATALQNGNLPVISEIKIVVQLEKQPKQ